MFYPEDSVGDGLHLTARSGTIFGIMFQPGQLVRVPRAPGLRLGLLTFPKSGIRLSLCRSLRRGLVSQC
jgi:hypothetical protein